MRLWNCQEVGRIRVLNSYEQIPVCQGVLCDSAAKWMTRSLETLGSSRAESSVFFAGVSASKTSTGETQVIH